MPKNYYLTSESVSAGHPDKVCDFISDSVLDAHLNQDPEARVACETLISNNLVVVTGEIKSQAVVNYEKIVREALEKVHYNDPINGTDFKTIDIMIKINAQSADISQAVDKVETLEDSDLLLGAGDQGLMYGFASSDTEQLMPLPISIAHALVESAFNKVPSIEWLKSDIKSQVTVEYCRETNKPVAIDTVVLSVMHSEEVTNKEITETMTTLVVKPVLKKFGFTTDNTKLLINPSGKFVIGMAKGDCGLTGRKIIVDTYGGVGRHGGGAFSGKDASKVDRSGAYAARYVAKNIVASGLASECEVQLSYAIGKAEPTSIFVLSKRDGEPVKPELLEEAVKQTFNLTPKGIIRELSLKSVGYKETASLGHFGRTGNRFTWEKTDKAQTLVDNYEKLVKEESKEEK